MITEKDIKEFYEDVTKLGLKFPVAAIAKATGYGKSNVSQYLKNKLEPSESFINAFYKAFPKSVQKVSSETAQSKASANNDTINSISESNRLIAESNASLARSNEELVALLKKVIGGVSQDEQMDPIRFASLEFLFEVAAGKQYKSIEEARKIWRNKIADESQAKMKKGIGV